MHPLPPALLWESGFPGVAVVLLNRPRDHLPEGNRSKVTREMLSSGFLPTLTCMDDFLITGPAVCAWESVPIICDFCESKAESVSFPLLSSFLGPPSGQLVPAFKGRFPGTPRHWRALALAHPLGVFSCGKLSK